MRSGSQFANSRRLLAVIAIVLVAGCGAWAQSDQDSSGNQGEPVVEPVASLANLPYGILPKHFHFGYGLTLSESYDDYMATSANGTGVSGTYTEIMPTLDLGRAGANSSFLLSYQPSYRLYRADRNLNVSTHQLNGFFNVRVTRHWRAAAGGNFTYLPDTEALFHVNQSQVQLDPNAAPAASAALPRRSVTQGSSFVQLQYQWSLRSYVSFGGTYHIQRFDANQLLGSNGYSAQASYNYRLGPRFTIATTYQFHKFWWQMGFGDAITHSANLGLSFRQSRRLSFSVSGGPAFNEFNRSSIVNLPPLLAILFGNPTLQLQSYHRQKSWSGSGQASYALDRTSFGLRYSRGISSGGGLYGSVQMQTAGLGMQRKIGRGSTFDFNADYVRSQFEGAVFLPGGRFSHITGAIRYTRPLTSRTSIFVNYQHFRQLVGSQVLNTNVLSRRRNVVTVGFTLANSSAAAGH